MKKVALIGLGAMGSFFAPKLWNVLGDSGFTVIAGGERRKRLTEKGVTINDVNYKFKVSDPEGENAPVDLIVIAVKSMQLQQAIRDIARFVGKETQIMCVLNGVDNEERVAARYGWEHVVFSYMRVSINMVDGVANYNPEMGKVHFGEKNNPLEMEQLSERVQKIKSLFDAAQINYQIDKDIVKGIWYKFMCNVGENLTCALLGVPFGAYQVSEHANAIRKKAMWEVVAIANAKGISLGAKEIEGQEKVLPRLPFHNKPSTLQDIDLGRKTEIELFAGKVLEYGKELGIETPICFMYYHGIRVLEEKNEGLFNEEKIVK